MCDQMPYPEDLERFIVRREYFGYLIYDRRTSSYHAFDEKIGHMLQKDRGHLSETLCEVKSGKSGSWNIIQELARGGISMAGSAIFRTVKPGIVKDAYLEELSFPLKIFLSVTNQCGLQCMHCYSRSEDLNENMLDATVIKRILDECEKKGCLQVSLSGGEPFMRLDILEILRYARDKGIWVSLATNGMLIDRHLLEEIRSTGINFLSLSIDGVSAKTYEHIRKGGSFEQVLEAARLIGKSDLDWAIHFTVMSHNFQEISMLPDLLQRISCRTLLLSSVKPAERALESEDLLLLPGQYRTLDDIVRHMRTSHPWLNITDFTTIHYHRRFGCAAGNSKLSVSAEGKAYPCDFLHRRDYEENIGNSSLEEIWNNSPIFRFMRRLKGNARCLSCKRYNSCRGGCRARSLYFSSDWNSPDPYCAEKH